MRNLTLSALAFFIFATGHEHGTRKYKQDNVNKDFTTWYKPAPPADSIKEIGKKVFLTNCNICHKDTVNSMIPGYIVLSSMSPRAIFTALESGKMKQQAINLSELQRKAVAEFVTNREIKPVSFPKESYTPFSLPANKITGFDYSGWGGNLEGTGFRSAAHAGISLTNLNSLKLKWAFAFPEGTITRGKPALVGDWLLVGSQFGDLFALNKNTGKIGWHFLASAAIRGAIAVVKKGNSITAFFADYSTNVYAVDVRTGKQIWNTRASIDQQSAITGSVVVYGDRVFVPISSTEVATAVFGKYDCCFSSGAVVALDASNGKMVWTHRVIAQKAIVAGRKKNGKPYYGPSGAPVWCSPTVDTKRGWLYIGTGENYTNPTTNTSDAIQAIEMKTGKLIWNFQGTQHDAYNSACPFLVNCPEKQGQDLDFGMAPILVKGKDGRDVLVAGQKSGNVFALSPDQGKLIWKTRIGKGGALGGIHWGMATDGKLVYAANADNILAVDKTDSLVNPSPGLYALDLLTGKIVWKTPAPDCMGIKDCYSANSAAPAVIPGVVFAGALDGHIRGYASKTGKILWEFNTVKEFETVDDIRGQGGAIDGPAPVISDGMLFVNSGYGMFGEKPGNVLLAFEVKK